jgi:restriction system protein
MKELFNYKYDDLFNPTLTALHKLGGSGSVGEIEEQVAADLKLTDGQVNEIHRGNTSKLTYRLAWAKNYLKRFGLLENSSRGVWTLTEEGLKTKSVDKEVVKRKVISDDKKERANKLKNGIANLVDEQDDIEELQKLTWQEEVIEELQKNTPKFF